MQQLKKYPPKLFHSKNIKDAFNIATQTKFSTLLLSKNPEIDAVFNPFFNLFQQTGKQQFYGHLARNNPLHEILIKNKSQECQLIFNAADVYISPTCYNQKQLTHNVVPTWNYVAAHFRGSIQMVSPEELLGILTKEVQLFEGEASSQWRLSDSSPDYVELLLKGIFGVKISVTSATAHMKLSQNKPHQRQNILKWTEKQEKQRKSVLNWMDEFK